MTDRGDIYCEQAYAQGKMLDNSSWDLPRHITPSDIDMVFDDARLGRLLFVELSSCCITWDTVSIGQRKLYSQLVANGCNKVFAVLAKHDVPTTSRINTRNDITHFQVMYFAALFGHATSQVYPGGIWPRFVDEFYAGKRFTFPAPDPTNRQQTHN